MSRILIGKAGNRAVAIDLDLLIRTRLLVQANSGGGKSFLLRRLSEQLFGKVPVLIIDPEGEFATLREKFGYVLVGKGGETPADPRSAALVAQKLLELRASAVCDLYEMKPSERHRWVRLFLEALIDAPKKLWRPTIVIVDEAHTFCPEKGAGESEASDAMTSLPTRGRKRRFCAVWATQRLGKLRKDASAELLNRMIGPTFEDVDLKRAADLLSIRSEDRRKFDQEMRVLEPGNFFALGRAISKERLLVRIAPVQTSHEIEDAKYGGAPPPPPEKIQALLPKLADLPQQAEEKAKTVGELKNEIRSLKAQLRAQPAAKPTAIMKAARDDQTLLRRWKAEVERQIAAAHAAHKALLGRGWRLAKNLNELAGIAASLFAVPAEKPAALKLPAADPQPARAAPPPPRRATEVPAASLDGISKPQAAILRALAEFEAIGRTDIPKTWVAARAGASHASSAFGNNLGALRSARLIEYPAPGRIRLSEAGRAHTPQIDPPSSSAEMLASCLGMLTRPQEAILKLLHEVHPEAIEKRELAERSGASAASSAYGNNLGALRSAGMIEYPSPGNVKCADWLFIE